jgi:hypothetical protein
MENPFFHSSNGPIQDNGSPEVAGWYFWDETGAAYAGPYDNKEEADKALTEYAKHL